jgi:outer membrane immunogenic protein
MLRNLLGVVGVSSLLIAAPLSAASAADITLPAKAFAAPNAPYSWSGCYAGGSAGVVRDSTAETWSYIFDDVGSYQLSDTGFLGSIDAGCNWQSGSFVYGLETDFGLSTINTKESESGPGFSYVEQEKLNELGTVRGRVGWAVDRALFYVTGGLAYGEVDHSATGTGGDDIYDFSASGWQAGWAVGAGADYAVTNNVSIRFEALYVDLGTKNIVDAEGDHASLGTSELVARIGANLKFCGIGC